MKNEYKFEKDFLFNNIEFLFNKKKQNNIKSLNRSIYKYFCIKKLINICFQNTNFIKRLFTVYFEFIIHIILKKIDNKNKFQNFQ